MAQAVGGDFEQIGMFERELLVSQGLRPDDFLVDVGCGSGRLAVQLVDYLTGRYLGPDVVPELLDHAKGLVGPRGWRFGEVRELVIPAEDGEADMVVYRGDDPCIPLSEAAKAKLTDTSDAMGSLGQSVAVLVR